MASSRCSSRANSHGSLQMDNSQSTVNSRTLADLPITEDLTLLRRRELELGMVLGRGRYSEVCVIEQIHMKEERENHLRPEGRYVMKYIQNKLFANKGHRRFARDLTNAVADLVTEAMYLSKLRHPHIIQLRGLTRGGTSVLKRSGAVAEDYFLVLERMEETLDQRIHQKWKKACDQEGGQQTLSLVVTKTRYVWQMANALTYLHNHQIIFRDCKPENCGILIQDPTADATDPNRDRLKIFDFGLARELDEPPPAPGQPEKLYSLSASGTRRYMSPEIFNGKGRYNYKADVYSWAIVFYECLSHVKPFADFTTQSHEELVCRLGGRPRISDIEWPAEGSEELAQQCESLLHSAWSQNPLERPSMAQVEERLEDILKGQGISPQSLASSSKETFSLQQQQHFFANDPEAVIFLKKKTSTSELTVATDPMASDSEVDDDHPKGRWSNSTTRSSISSLGVSVPRLS